MAGFAQGQKVIWNNQKELSRSEELLDEQFAVSTRLSVSHLNLLFEAVGKPELKITEKTIEDTFRQWAEFRKRRDFRELMTEWMVGMALEAMPPEPPAPVEQPPEKLENAAQNELLIPSEATMAKKQGETDAESNHGDQDTEQGQSESGGQSQVDDVPQVQM